MQFKSVFDIIGPVMIGPSSSHTAGANRIGRVARKLFGRLPESVTVTLYGSFAKTYKGHGTDLAIVSGILDFDTADERIPDALSIAQEKGLHVVFVQSDDVVDHPNTARITLRDKQSALEVVGISIGGGSMEIREVIQLDANPSGSNPAMLVLHEDKHGAVAHVTTLLADYHINIGYMEVSRSGKGQSALMAIEVDQSVDDAVIHHMHALPHITEIWQVKNYQRTNTEGGRPCSIV
ncbi:L-serine ammonia-lyase, iron-sulfur-dependent subunit beta [Paenibacillus apiarius]|uniref:L-serine deaminase n=1 Tax=Paenibacillus apiarius TaxID=46240 RepID=A0ABT4E057_9BACL|nr:L-serine ammonia-lyase, iron-sulfur-dependent subunit beta [Paenibacillus apiarius]MBN3522747.1 L-serine ammonia-lyase, iron-sulfur-dependent subunit beta [Paenibacillus apiarius]MCY9515043.1 L-serine ammonia-lyase, iron-sulfur-dependent subunit beta [Paenibacillus apiarius]MCY9522971.1 L-serine ammonia-lyase, iron-sulfur-dependent subunit beta [Paenibacillus apiarius]MCY9553774.1 L-serine ammonia-lyase, iron-sulfur-dependent subunit beta [Paenibacillus apiarius]MCY9556393.1 L-serine ammoni